MTRRARKPVPVSSRDGSLVCKASEATGRCYKGERTMCTGAGEGGVNYVLQAAAGAWELHAYQLMTTVHF